jgi:hypothetical protein
VYRDGDGRLVDADGRRIDVMGRPPGHSAWRRFTDRYGWRAYALPVLVCLTAVALVTTGSHRAARSEHASAAGPGPSRTQAAAGQPQVAASSAQLKNDDPGASARVDRLKPLQLPAGGPFTQRGTGTFETIPGKSPVIGHGTVRKFSIEIENGVSGVNPDDFARTVVTALSNPQSWIATGTVALQRVDSGPVDFHVSLTSQMTVRALCGYDLPVETSCFDDADARVVLNVARWVRGAQAYASDIATYRLYAVNHEVGHALGHNHSHECLPGGLAPVMMQQTIGLKTAYGAICQPNPWPYPKGVAGTPGHEESGDAPDLAFYERNST